MQPAITALEANAYLKGYSDAQSGRMIDLEFLRRTPSISLEPAMAEERLRFPSGPSTNKPRRRKTRYQATYKRNFNKIKPNYVKKNGQWKQGGFKRAVKEAHRMTKKQLS